MWDKIDLMMQPSIWDSKYDNMSKEERRLNYERDLMLYHQTLAIKNMEKNNTNNTSSQYDKTQYTPSEYDLKQLKESMLSDEEYYALNGLEYGSPEYIQYTELKQKADTLLNKANYLALNVKGFIWFLISVLVCLGLPALIIANVKIVKVVIIVSMILVVFAYMYANYLEKTYIKKAKQLRNKKMKIIYECKKAQQLKEENAIKDDLIKGNSKKEILTLEKH